MLNSLELENKKLMERLNVKIESDANNLYSKTKDAEIEQRAMKLKLSVAGLEQVKTRWAQKQKEGWTREHLCTEASQFAEPDRNWEELFNLRSYALNCTPETLDRFLRDKNE